MIGSPRDVNNLFFANLWIQKRYRINGKYLRSSRLNFSTRQHASYDRKVSETVLNFNGHLEYQFKSIGRFEIGTGGGIGNGDFRLYKDDSHEITTALHQTYSSAVQRDNFGYFLGQHYKKRNIWLRIATDNSKPLNTSMFFRRSIFKQSLITSSDIILRIKPSENLQFEANFNKTNIEGSDFLSARNYNSYSLKTEYSVLDNLFLKVYTQYNTQSKYVSNNAVVTFEYQRGSFLYLAFSERGLIDETYQNGSLYSNYSLKNRTISLKGTYSLYL